MSDIDFDELVAGLPPGKAALVQRLALIELRIRKIDGLFTPEDFKPVLRDMVELIVLMGHVHD